MHMLQTHAPVILSDIAFILMLFRPSTNTIRMRFRFDPLSRAFSSLCIFDENAQRVSVDVRPKRIEMYGFRALIKPEKVLWSLQLWPYSGVPVYS